MSTFYGNYPVSSSASGGGNPSVGPNGTSAPIESTEIGFIDGSGNLQGVSPTNPLPVTIESEVGTLNVNVSEYGGVATTLGQKVSASSLPVVIASDQSAVPISAASLPLPTGAATNSELITINSTLGSPFQAGGSIGNTSFIATQSSGSNLHVDVDNFPATQAVTQSTSPWVVSGTVTSSVNSNAQVNNSTVVGTSPITFTPPANAVGFVVEAESSNTVNLRYAAGTTASTTVGMLLEPGRDSGYIPTSAIVTVCAVSSSAQSASIQWVMSS